jgi:hypothetical protein
VERKSISISVPSTGNLQILLQQKYLRHNFLKFITTSWNPSPDVGLNNIETNEKETAINCLSFWMDVKDFVKLVPSTFQAYRAGFLFEKYLMHGALKHVSSL